jgi:hypothetical protein
LRSLLRASVASKPEIKKALAEVGPPFDFNTVFLKVREIQGQGKDHWRGEGTFVVTKGFKIRKNFFFVNNEGKEEYRPFVGEVISMQPKKRRNDVLGKVVDVWSVRYTDNDVEDMEKREIYRHRADRDHLPPPVLGRPMQFLELFCGKG